MRVQTVGKVVGRKIHRLTALGLKAVGEGKHADGGGLYYQVKGRGRSWLYRYEIHGKERWMGLGPYPAISLAKARSLAQEARETRARQLDPIEVRNQHIEAERLSRASSVTFEEAAERYISANSPGWKNDVHRKQWNATLARYAFPVFGKFPVSEVDTGHVLKALEPIWTLRPETASRVRGRIEAILNWASVRG